MPLKSINYHQFDLIILGSGAAGLTLALEVAKFAKVAILSKATLEEGNTKYAQGGVAAVVDKADSFLQHTQDTLAAGDGLCHQDVVARVVEGGPQVIDWLLAQGVNFSKSDLGDATHSTNTSKSQSLHLHQEGGHSQRAYYSCCRRHR